MSAQELAPGHKVGNYRVQGLLGRTSWAATYAAYVGDDEVAVKVIEAKVADHEGLLEELEKAHAVLREVPQDVVLAPLERGIDASSGAHFFVSRLSSHPSLADLVEICPLSAIEIVDLVASLAAALGPLHDKGLGHLALKPTNVFVGPPPAHAVRLGDFGADALRRAAGAAHPWLAPEQAEGGEGVTPGPRADVFTAALLVFFALTGRSFWSASGDEELVAEMRGPRVPPSKRARDVGVEIDPSMDEVLGRALSADPEARFPNVRAFADALSVGLDDLTPVAPEAVPTEPPREAPNEPRKERASSGAPKSLSKPTPVAEFVPITALSRPTPVPGSLPAAELPSQRHIKATAKLLRFELPSAKKSAPKPIVRAGTVRIGKFDLDMQLATALEEHAEVDLEAVPPSAPPQGRATVRMPPAPVPPEAIPPIPPPAPMPAIESAHAFQRFDLPAAERVQRGQQGPQLVTVIIIIGVAVIALLLALIVILLTTRH